MRLSFARSLKAALTSVLFTVLSVSSYSLSAMPSARSTMISFFRSSILKRFDNPARMTTGNSRPFDECMLITVTLSSPSDEPTEISSRLFSIRLKNRPIVRHSPPDSDSAMKRSTRFRRVLPSVRDRISRSSPVSASTRERISPALSNSASRRIFDIYSSNAVSLFFNVSSSPSAIYLR